jgi:hypothetical protein
MRRKRQRVLERDEKSKIRVKSQKVYDFGTK